LKRPWLAGYLGPEAMDLNRRIKQALDPAGILNPGGGHLALACGLTFWDCCRTNETCRLCCLTGSSSPLPTPGRIPGRCTAGLRDHDPVHHVVPPSTPRTTTTYCRGTPTCGPRRANHETFSSAKGLTVNYGDLEMIGLQDNPPCVMQDPPVHTQFASWCRAVSPRGRWRRWSPRCASVRRPAHRAAARGAAAATSSPSCSSRCRRWWSRIYPWCARRGLGPVRRLDPGHRRGQHRRGRHRRGTGDRRRCGRDDDGLLPPRWSSGADRTRGRHHLAPGGGGVGADGDIAGVLSILAFTFTMVTAATTPSPACSAAPCHCCTSGPISADCWSRTPG